ncbi:hypothetical protein GGR50DRAFT_207930 [Xylaria sp. CBS 124048]|nr:hypothetical protein GGR50DRAFT_207930 [Xylaria sp. CBS 124048]
MFLLDVWILDRLSFSNTYSLPISVLPTLFSSSFPPTSLLVSLVQIGRRGTGATKKKKKKKKDADAITVTLCFALLCFALLSREGNRERCFFFFLLRVISSGYLPLSLSYVKDWVLIYNGSTGTLHFGTFFFVFFYQCLTMGIYS